MRHRLLATATAAASAAVFAAGALLWLVADGATAVQTMVVAGAVLAVGLLNAWQTRRLDRKVEAVRRVLLGTDPTDLGIRAPSFPQEHFERLTQLLAANNRRLEEAIDDLARRLPVPELIDDAIPTGTYVHDRR